VKKLVDKIDKALMFSMVLRTILAVYIQLCIIAFSGYYEGTASGLNYLFTALVIAFCLLTFVVAVKPSPEYLQKPEVVARIGTLYDLVNTENWTSLAFTSVFCARRIFFVLLVLQPILYFKLPLLQFICLVQLCYYFHVKPFKEESMALLEYFNEAVVLLSLYLLVLFSNYVADVKVKFDLGIAFGVLVLILFLVNLARAMYVGL